ncbi:MAG TPA: class I tRNA ligase family protein, partial [Candidatus Binataceae bacterium]|nr:class I tRNA ligase family protein [Candidatus Binataceae bacterium]
YLTRVWNLVRRYVEAGAPAGSPSVETQKRAHKTIATVTEHVEKLRFNTAFSTLMDQLNYLAKLKPEEMGRFALESYLLMLAPMAPHITEVFWRELGHYQSIHLESWPEFDPALIVEEQATVVVQINGKVRDRLQVRVGATEDEVKALALASEAVRRHLDGKPPRKFIFVPDKMLSIVV